MDYFYKRVVRVKGISSEEYEGLNKNFSSFPQAERDIVKINQEGILAKRSSNRWDYIKPEDILFMRVLVVDENGERVWEVN